MANDIMVFSPGLSRELGRIGINYVGLDLQENRFKITFPRRNDEEIRKLKSRLISQMRNEYFQLPGDVYRLNHYVTVLDAESRKIWKMPYGRFLLKHDSHNTFYSYPDAPINDNDSWILVREINFDLG